MPSTSLRLMIERAHRSGKAPAIRTADIDFDPPRVLLAGH